MDPAKTREPTTPPSSSPGKTETELLLVDAHGEKEVEQHPEIKVHLTNGWEIRRAAPRIVEPGGAKWIVVLERPAGPETSPIPRDNDRYGRSPRKDVHP